MGPSGVSQCTADLLPSDITGVYVFDQGTREFSFRPGPVMANVVLVDEINRASPKTQSALFECMEERQITIEGVTHPMPDPFLLLATRNPTEHGGTFPLPETELDRFLLRVRLDYPTHDEEVSILANQLPVHPIGSVEQVVEEGDMRLAQEAVGGVYVDRLVMEYIVSLVNATRNHELVFLGASPRASLGLMGLAQARALLDGRDYAVPDDVKEVALAALGTMPYTLSTGQAPPGQDWVEFFLFVDRKGYCQNYASAMITMLRSLGIPARLVVGFAPGVWDQERGVWRVRSRHYHAWPEVYFPEYGWVEFEPTPADVQDALEHLGIRPQGRLASTSTDLDPCSDPFLVELCLNSGEPIGDVADLLNELLDEEGDPVGAGIPAQGGSGLPWALLGLGLALALALPVGTVSYVRWSIPRLGYTTVIYASMGVLGRLGGVGLRPYDTPWEYCARLSRALPGHADSVTRITRGFVATRYGPSKGMTSGEMDGVRDSWRALRKPLLRLALLRLLRWRRNPSGAD